MPHRSGRHFLQLPGPTNVPDRILRAMHRPVIDHRGPEFARMTLDILRDLEALFGGAAHVFVFPSSATGCWEAALANTLSAGERVLLYDNGFFANKWGEVARRLGLEPLVLEGDWRLPVDPERLESALRADAGGRIRAVLVVHNETSTGVTSDIRAVRHAIDGAGHDALLMVDAVSSLGATAYRQADWRVDVTVCGSQKGLMLPPGLAFCAVSERALAASGGGGMPRAYWDFGDMRRFNEDGFFPSTPATTLLYGLAEALAMLEEEGHDRVFARHARLAEATRRAVAGWGLETYCGDPAAASNAGTTVVMPDSGDADAFRAVVLERYDMSLGTGLGRLGGDVFRIGHLGDLNELMVMGTLAGVEMGLEASGIEVAPGGLDLAMRFLVETGA